MIERWIGQYILDADGLPVPEPDVLKWAEWMETAERGVARDELPGGITVSTIFLGLDQLFHSMPEQQGRDPILWETMIFADRTIKFQERHTTREQALAGHTEALRLARELNE